MYCFYEKADPVLFYCRDRDYLFKRIESFEVIYDKKDVRFLDNIYFVYQEKDRRLNSFQ
jgi:hypothetical protein